MMNTASAEGARGQQGGDFAFLAVVTLIFGSAGAATIHGCLSMPMLWMRMPGQTWPGAAAQFAAMWVTMMMAMMLPSLTPSLWQYRQALDATGTGRRGLLTTLMGTGYFSVWSAVGMAVFPIGVALAAIETRVASLARAAPTAVGVLLVLAGSLQFTKWKAHHLACCRKLPGSACVVPTGVRASFRQGVRFGLHCSFRCAGPTVILLCLGAMDLRVMAIVTLVITSERLAPAAVRVARAIGTVAVAAGFALLVLR